MKQLTAEQLYLSQEYLNMVSAIEEGFDYVLDSFNDFSKTEGDLVLSDIFQAFTSIAETNLVFDKLLVDDEAFQQSLQHFHEVTNAATQLDGNFADYDKKVKVITNVLYPAYSVWKNSVQNTLSKYVAQ